MIPPLERKAGRGLTNGARNLFQLREDFNIFALCRSITANEMTVYLY